MKSSLLNEIFELVKSLTKSEKRYFTLYSKFQGGDKNYLKLFNIIDKQPTYNERLIDVKFNRSVQAKNYPVVKKYLFEQLIAALKSYGSYKDLDSDHSDLIETYKVLHYKGLYGQSKKLLKKIKSITLEDDAFIRHYYVLLLEYREELYNQIETSSPRLKQVFEERKKTLKIIQNYSWVGDIFTYQRIHLRKKLYCRNNKDKQELTKLVAPLLKTTEADMLSRTALGLRNMALCDYYVAIGKPHKAFETSKVYLELRKNAGSFDKVESQTISEYASHLWLSVKTGYFEGFTEYWKQFHDFMLSIRNWDKKVVAYERWLASGLVYYIRTGQYTNAMELISAERKNYLQYEKTMGMKGKITLWYFIAVCYYFTGEHQNALKLIQKIMNTNDSEAEEYSFSKLLLMFIHYDLRNFELLEYQVRATQRLMEKKERLYTCEKLLLDFFRNCNAVDSRKELNRKLSELQIKVTTLFKTPFERGFDFYFNILGWISARLKTH